MHFLEALLKQLILLFMFMISLSAFAAYDPSVLCATDSANQINFANSILPRDYSRHDEINLLIWNAHKLEDKQFFFDLKELSNNSDVIMIQEAMHSTGWQKAFASHFPMSFNFFKSFCPDEKATGVMTAARATLQHNLTLVAPALELKYFTPKVSGYSQIQMGDQTVHLFNTHALNFNAGGDFRKQVDQVVEFIAGISGPVIWAGDFNTWDVDVVFQSRLSYLLEKAASVGLLHVIPKADHRRGLILDHIFVRGFTATKTEVLKHQSSDHYPLRTTLRLN